MDIHEQALRYRAALARRDKAAVDVLLEEYRAIYARLLRKLAGINNQIAERRRLGQSVSGTWLFQQERYQGFLRAIDLEFRRYAGTTQLLVNGRREVEVARGAADTYALGTAAQSDQVIVSASFTKPSPEAIEAVVANLRDESPLGKLFNTFGPAAKRGAADALRNGVALGYGPAKIAKDVQIALAVPRWRAVLIARTEALRAYRQASQATMEANADILAGWRWTCSISRRTCFPAGTMIETARGIIPIERIQQGDMVLTHRGRMRRVTETLAQEYLGSMVTVFAGGRSLTGTADHPLLCREEGLLYWRQMGETRPGTPVYVRRQGGHQRMTHFVSEGAIKRRSDQPDNIIATIGQCERFTRISTGILMPVRFINFNDSLGMREEEVNGVAPAGNLVFLNKRHLQPLKEQPNSAFGFGFTSEFSPAGKTAERVLPSDQSGSNPKFPFASGTGMQIDRASANFRAMFTVGAAWMWIKTFFASQAIELYSCCLFARPRAKAAIVLCTMSKLLPALRTCGHVHKNAFAAFLRAIAARISFCWDAKYHATFFARNLFGRSGLPASGGMGVKPLVLSVAGPRTEGDRSALDSRGGAGKTDSANHAIARDLLVIFPAQKYSFALAVTKGVFGISVADVNPCASSAFTATSFDLPADTLALNMFHEAIIAQKSTHWHSQVTVYNLEVEEDCSYVANGLVVHNCLNCLSRDGDFYPVTKPLPGHPACRCTATPELRGMPPALRQTGAQWFANQPIEIQREMMGASALEAYRAGRITLDDFEGQRRSRQWGETTYQRSLKEILASRRELVLN